SLAARINWTTLQWIEKEIPIAGPEPRSVVADLVGLTQDVEGRYLEVLIHPEIQMRTGSDIGWRIMQYNAGLVLQQGNPDSRVLSFVFYHCRGAGDIQRQRYEQEFYDYELLGVSYWSVGLGELDAEQYAASENP